MASAAEMEMRRAATTMAITMASQHRMVSDQLNPFYMMALQPFHKRKVHSIHRQLFHHSVSAVEKKFVVVWFE